VAPPQLISVLLHLDKPEPYFDFEPGFTNATVFELIFSHIEGRTVYRAGDLSNVPAGMFKEVRIPHAKYKTLSVRQYLTTDTAAQIEETRTAAKTYDELPSVGLSKIFVIFTYSNHLGVQKTVRVSLSGDLRLR